MLVEMNPSEVIDAVTPSRSPMAILVADLVWSLLSMYVSVQPSPPEAHLNLDMAPVLANSQDLFSM